MKVSFMIHLHGNNGDNDDEDGEDNAADDELHLEVLPPHLLADPLGARGERVGGRLQVLRPGVQLAELDVALQDLVDVVPHDVDHLVHLDCNRKIIL